MPERIPKPLYLAVLVGGVLALSFVAYLRPGYFTTPMSLGGLLLLEFLAVAVWMYRRVFFPLVILAFLLAGLNLPVGGFWTQARWVFLSLGALVGSILIFKERNLHFGLFHIVITFAALGALVSAAVSQYPSVALLKAVSLALLFIYAGTGARLAVTGRENRFFAGLLTGCELFAGALAFLYVLGIDAMGNPNSLGAVIAVVGAPILLWGTQLEGTSFVRRRRLLLFAACMYLIFHSQARAAMAAAAVSCTLLCFGLRKYGLIWKGAGIVLILVSAAGIIQPEAVSEGFSTLVSSVLYKGNRDSSVLGSRESPWRVVTDSIKNHFWFGTGLGTGESARDSSGRVGMFSSSASVTTENGSSYLSIVAGVGVLGAFPFALALLVLTNKIVRTGVWLRKVGRANHPAIPLTLVMVAGLIHAGFEDWLFAPGSYLCVWFWTIAFILVDVAPLPVMQSAVGWRFPVTDQGLGGVASSR